MPFPALLTRIAAHAAAASLFVLPVLATATPPTPSAIDQLAGWFAPPEFDEPKLSPDGKFLAFIVRDGENYAIGIFDFATRQVSVSGGSGKLFPTNFWWKGPRRILTQVISTDGKSLANTAFDIDGKNPELLSNLTESAGDIIDALPSDPDHVLRATSIYGRTRGVRVVSWAPNEVFRFNLRNGKTTKVAGDIGPVHDWFLDRTLAVRAAFHYINDGTRTLHWRTPTGSEWKKLRLEPADPGFEPEGMDADLRHLWVWDYTKKPAITLSRFDTVTGQLVPGIGAAAGAEPTSVLSFAQNRQPVAALYSQSVPVRIEALNETWRPAIELLQKRFSGYTPKIVDQLPDGRRWVVSATSSRFPGGYFLFDHQTGDTTLIATAYNPALKENLFVPAVPIEVRSRHGFSIRGRVWLPRGVKHPPILVMCPSSLPAIPALDVFNPYIQAYVAGGYAVAQFDGRGTKGYGRDFDILLKDSPAEMLREDLEDGVAGLAAQGQVDGQRAVLFGYGFGGALALAAAEKSAVFRAVASVNAPIEVEQWDLLNRSHEFSRRVLADKMGWRNSLDVAKALSPLEVAPRLQIPSLHLMNEARWKPGKLSDDAQRLERAVKNSRHAKVDLAYSWFQGYTPPAVFARDRASAVLRTLAFFDESLGIR